MNFIRINLNHFKINVLKQIAVLTEDYIMEEEDNLHAQWYLTLHDIIASKLYDKPQFKQTKTRLHELCLQNRPPHSTQSAKTHCAKC